MRLSWHISMMALFGCASFKNVDATAKLGIALGSQPVVASQWLAECEAVHATGNDSALETICRARDNRYEAMADTVRGASDLLQAYATALSSATNHPDVAIDDDATALLTQLGAMNTDALKVALPAVYNLTAVVARDSTLIGKLTPTGTTTIVDTVVRFASQSYRRAEIASTVSKAAPHIEVLAAFVEAEVQLHRADVADLRDAVRAEVSARPLTEVTPAVEQMLSLTVAALDTRIASLNQLDAACQAFRVAHRKLAKRIQDNKPWQHEEMLAELKHDVEVIVGALRGGSSQAAAFAPTARITERH